MPRAKKETVNMDMEKAVENLVPEVEEKKTTKKEFKEELPEIKTVIVTCGLLNIRSTPDASKPDNIIGMVSEGDTLVVEEELKDSDFIKVSTFPTMGYVMKKFVK